jgi:hypothetical protein
LDGLHNALIACTAIALAGAVATAWLLIPGETSAETEAVTETV